MDQKNDLVRHLPEVPVLYFFLGEEVQICIPIRLVLSTLIFVLVCAKVEIHVFSYKNSRSIIYFDLIFLANFSTPK